MSRRRNLKEKLSLPFIYLKVEYLRTDLSTGSFLPIELLCYIDSGNNDYDIRYKYNNLSDIGNLYCINDRDFGKFPLYGTAYVYYGVRSNFSEAQNVVHTCNDVYDHINHKALFFSDDNLKTTINHNCTLKGNLKIILPWGRGTYYTHELYYFTVFENGKLKLDLYPVFRKEDNKPGFFDTVSQTFYTNSGTGEFIVGPNV